MSNPASLVPFKKGKDPRRNIKGKPFGQRDYKTIYKEALIKLALLNNKTPEELEEEIISSGIKLARTGNYAFYKDILDRVHGLAKGDMGGGTSVVIKLVGEVAKQNGININPKTGADSTGQA